MTDGKIATSPSLGSTLDRLLEETTSQQGASFHAMVKAAGLDPSRDFVGASLRNLDFRDEDLRGFDFSNADLSGADFRRANVDGVAFRDANLRGTIGLPGMNVVLPRVSANLFSGLIETLAAEPYNGNADVESLADELHLDVGELLPVVEAMQMFDFATFANPNVELTEIGKRFAELDTDDRKKLFKSQLLSNVPLAAHIQYVLLESPDHQAAKTRFLSELGEHMSPQDAEHTLRAVTAWGRYAEIFEYDDDNEIYTLTKPVDI